MKCLAAVRVQPAGRGRSEMKTSRHLEHPSEPEAGVHELNDVQQNLDGSDVSVEAVPEINVLHLWDHNHRQ